MEQGHAVESKTVSPLSLRYRSPVNRHRLQINVLYSVLVLPRNSSINLRIPSRISNNSFRASAIIFSGRIFFGCEGNEPFLGRVVEEVGEDLFIYSSDYPHADRTEGTAQYLKQRDDIPETVRRKLLEDNARRFYNL